MQYPFKNYAVVLAHLQGSGNALAWEDVNFSKDLLWSARGEHTLAKPLSHLHISPRILLVYTMHHQILFT